MGNVHKHNVPPLGEQGDKINPGRLYDMSQNETLYDSCGEVDWNPQDPVGGRFLAACLGEGGRTSIVWRLYEPPPGSPMKVLGIFCAGKQPVKSGGRRKGVAARVRRPDREDKHGLGSPG